MREWTLGRGSPGSPTGGRKGEKEKRGERRREERGEESREEIIWAPGTEQGQSSSPEGELLPGVSAQMEDEGQLRVILQHVRGHT